MTGPAILDRSCAYRREARRIRGRLAHKPVQRYCALRELSHRHDTAEHPAVPAAGFHSPANAFAQLASEQLAGPVLSYSKRLGLLRAARRMGIGRFEANLIIAAIQHRTTGSSVGCHRPAARTRFGAAPLLTFLVLQSLILVGLWGIFFR